MRPGASSLAALATFCALALGACGDVLQDQPIGHNILEGVMLAHYPVYWVGGSFEGLSITEAARDPGGATSIQYGDCLEGGQGTCVAPLLVITSPDNSFLPGGALAAHHLVRVRGVTALLAQGGDTVEIPTGSVVVDIYARTPRVAAAAARAVVPINAVAESQGPLPARLPDSGFANTPLPSQMPPPLRAPG